MRCAKVVGGTADRRGPVVEREAEEVSHAFVGARQIGQEGSDPAAIQAAHDIDAQPPHAVPFIKQRGNNQQPLRTVPVKSKRIFSGV